MTHPVFLTPTALLIGLSVGLECISNASPWEDSSKAGLTHGPFVGHVTAGSAVIWARCSNAGEYRLTATAASDGESTSVAARPAVENDWCVKWRLRGLNGGTRYTYRITAAATVLVGGDDCFFSTDDVNGRGIVRLAFGSCAKEDEGSSAVWNRMRVLNPHAVILLGDTPYIDSTELDVQRRRYREFAAVPAFQRLLSGRSLYATWDDHDFGRNDTDGNLKGKENSRRVFMEYRANPFCGDGTSGIYTKFRRGCVEVFLLDTRFFAATEPSPFDADRPTLLGKKQWDWLFRELKVSTAPFKVLACGMVWNGAVRPGKRDHWGTYSHERQALFDFIGREKIAGVVLVGGDVHRSRVLRYKTTDSAGYEIPEFITSPIHDGVIERANALHPALVHDSGEPNSFLLMTADTRRQPAMLTAALFNKDGRQLFTMNLSRKELEAQQTR